MAPMFGGAFQETAEARNKWKRARLTPAQLSTYFVGSLAFWDLELAARRRAALAALRYGGPQPEQVLAMELWDDAGRRLLATGPGAGRTRMEKRVAGGEASQPIRAKTGGSTFKNPQGQKTWQLIDEAGCRGLRHGSAQVSEKHCNFLINTDNASAADLEALGEEVRKRVKEKSGVTLEWEIKRVGVP